MTMAALCRFRLGEASRLQQQQQQQRIFLRRSCSDASPAAAGKTKPQKSAIGLLSRPTSVANTGSIARDILAAERTFLAWARTGLGFVGAGSALFASYHRKEENDRSASHTKRRNEPQTMGEVLYLPANTKPNVPIEIFAASFLLVCNGAGLLGFAVRRYLVTVRALRQHEFVINTSRALVAIAGTASTTLTSLGLVLIASSDSSEGEK